MNGAPTEIWAEIIDHALYDNLLFLSNPLESDYSFQTALREWSGHNRGHRFELQRRILRSVSTTWKDLVDRSPYRYFGPPFLCDTADHLERASNARRLQLDASCPDCGCIWSSLCSECSNYHSKIRMQDWPTLDKLIESGICAEILDVTSWDLGHLVATAGARFATLVPRLRSLTIRGGFDGITLLDPYFTHLVVLTLTAYHPTGVPQGICFQDLVVLRFVALGGYLTAWLLEGWSLPSLQHLEVEWNLQQSPVTKPPLSFTLIRAYEDGAEAPHRDAVNDMLVPSGYLELFRQNFVYQSTEPLSDIWKTFIEETATQHGHVFEQVDDDQPGTILLLRRHLGSGHLIKTYGSHTWEKFLGDFAGRDAVPSLGHSPQCNKGWECWICVAEFLNWCSINDLGCEDRDGKTFEEVSGRQRTGVRSITTEG